jgi:hypothetical protein
LKRFRRIPRTLNWTIELDEPFLELAEHSAIDWMQREFNYKGQVKGGLLNKASGIIAELILRSMLDELNIPHVATEPLLDKKHPVNVGKMFDIKLTNGSTIDVKALPADQHYENLNLNQLEAQRIGVCDFYILFKCSDDYSNDEAEDMRKLDRESARFAERLWKEPKSSDAYEKDLKEFIIVKEKLHSYIARIKNIAFISWVRGDDLVQPKNLKRGEFGDYYQLSVLYGTYGRLLPPFYSMDEFADAILHIKDRLQRESKA